MKTSEFLANGFDPYKTRSVSIRLRNDWRNHRDRGHFRRSSKMSKRDETRSDFPATDGGLAPAPASPWALKNPPGPSGQCSAGAVIESLAAQPSLSQDARYGMDNRVA